MLRFLRPYPTPPRWGRGCTPGRKCDSQWKGWVADADNSNWPRKPLRRGKEDTTDTSRTEVLLRLAAAYHG